MSREEAPVGKRNVSYPSPFFDVGQRYIPTNIKEIFKWTRYHYISSSVIHPIIQKISEYPVTGFTYGGVHGAAEKQWKRVLETTMGMRSFLIGVHQDLHVYGNAFALINYPFVRYLISASGRYKASDVSYKIKFEDKKWKFHGMDPKLKVEVTFEVQDIYVANKNKIGINRLNPQDIDIEYNSITGDSYYNWSVPQADQKKIRSNLKVYLDNTPQIVFDAMAQGKKIELDENHFYHFTRPTIAGLWPGWGTPTLVPVLKDIHYYSIMRKANEALALQHINPLLVLFPQANADITPYKSLNLSDWKRRVEDELARWRKDPNYMPVMPVPVGSHYIGGNAKQFMVTQEAEFVARGIAAALGVPLEFLTGGLSWSGSSVSLRVLENAFIKQREQDLEFLNNFLIPRIEKYFKLPNVDVKLKNFKMADDVQFQQIMVNLMQGGFVSRKRVLDQWSIPHQEEFDQMRKEHSQLAAIQRDDQISNAEVQSLMMSIQARSQAMAQHEAQRVTEELANDSRVEKDPEVNTKASLIDIAQKYASQIMVMPPESASGILTRMKEEMPQLFSLVMKHIQHMKQQAHGPEQEIPENTDKLPPVGGDIQPTQEKKKDQVNMDPLPEQRPPRRAGVV